MSGFVGLSPAKKQRRELFVSQKQFQNSRTECVDLVVGPDVLIGKNMEKKNLKSKIVYFLPSVLFLVGAAVFDVFVGQYINNLSYGAPLSDLLLNKIPVIDLRIIEVFGFELILIIYFLYPLFRTREKIPYIFNQTALLIIIRNISIVITHLPSPAGSLDHNIVPILSYLTFEHDLIFSGHVAFPFLAFLMYKTEKIRNFFLIGSIVMAVTVLLTHSHYSVDVWAAFFFTYTSYKLGEYFFKPKKA
ncbi:MAG: hypothetical protein RJA61_411 [Candidatus Parcubacteria bacterium]|jgi:hypothetical protein